MNFGFFFWEEVAMKYRNAVTVIPPKLLRRIQEYHEGLLYIPSTGNSQRDREILALHQRGLTVSQIAKQVYLSRRRVLQILRHTGE